MRILMLSHGYPPTISGVTLVVQKLARAMVRRGHDVTVVTASQRHAPYRTMDEGVRLIRVRGLPNLLWKEGPIPIVRLQTLLEIAAEVQPDVIHAHEAAQLGRQALRLKARLDVPAVATCYFVPRFIGRHLSVTEEPNPIAEQVVWRYSVDFFNQSFDRVVFGTEAHRRLFVNHGLTARTTIITNGLAADRYYPADGQQASDGAETDLQRRYDLPPRPRVLFVSRLMRDKEIDILIRAMPAITVEHPAHLLIVGRGQDWPRLQRIVDELGLRACVHFLGFVPEADLPALYRASDLFAIVSTCEVQSIPTLQATATALPVVAANAVALPELVKHGVNGFLVPPGDPQAVAQAVSSILGDPRLAARMGQASLDISRPHAETHTFDLYEQLYREVVARDRPDEQQT